MPRPRSDDRSTVAEKNVTFRVSTRTRAYLDALVALADEKVSASGGRVSMGSYLTSLIEREAKAKGIEATVPDIVPAPTPAPAPSKPARKR